MRIQEYTFQSASGICPIKAWQWSPDNGRVKAVIQFHHGMAEHSGRYQKTMQALTDLGYAVFMNDMLGHGRSNKDPALLGYFGDKNGYKNILNDAKTLTDIAKEEYPDLPFIIIGHSMGSFVMRCYINEFGAKGIDAAVYIGTSGDNPLASVSIALTNIAGAVMGKTHHSKAFAKISSKGYNDRNENKTQYDWLTKDEKTVSDYINDPLCGFCFTIQGYQDLARLVMECNDSSWYANMPQNLPVLLVCGSDDPVGGFGKGVKDVYDKLKATGHNKAQIIIYPGYRHEVLNEADFDKVIDDIEEFISKSISKTVSV